MDKKENQTQDVEEYLDGLLEGTSQKFPNQAYLDDMYKEMKEETSSKFSIEDKIKEEGRDIKMEELINSLKDYMANQEELDKKLKIAKVHKDKDEEKMQEIMEEYEKDKANIRDEEFGILKKDVIKEFEARIASDEEEIANVEAEIRAGKDDFKNYVTDENIRTATMAIKELDKKIELKNIEISKKNLEIQENLLNEDKDGKSTLDIYNELSEIEKQKEEFEKARDEYKQIIDMLKSTQEQMLMPNIDLNEKNKAKEEIVKPEEAKPETAKPETAKPETAKPETAKPETQQKLELPKNLMTAEAVEKFLNLSHNENLSEEQKEEFENMKAIYGNIAKRYDELNKKYKTDLFTVEEANEYSQLSEFYMIYSKAYEKIKNVKTEGIDINIEDRLDLKSKGLIERNKYIGRFRKLEAIINNPDKESSITPEMQKEYEILKNAIKVLQAQSNEVKIKFDASINGYTMFNVGVNETKVIDRKSIHGDVQRLIADISKKYDNIARINPEVLQVLKIYDNIYLTDKAGEYLNIVTAHGKQKNERKVSMRYSGISIMHDLKRIYKNKNISKVERKRLLDNAKIDKEIGVGTVKKGLWVLVREKIEDRIDKMKLTKTEPKSLPPSARAKSLEQRMKEWEEEQRRGVNVDPQEAIEKLEHEKTKQGVIETEQVTEK